ncbi:unnamed protein product [Phaeothamnion confervicola]
MIKVRRIGHASFVTPDVSRQVAYYTDVLGLTLVDRTSQAAYLAGTNDHHSVVIRHGEAPQCTHLSFQVSPLADLGEFERQVKAHGIKVERTRDAEPSIPDMVVFDNPAGTKIQVYTERSASAQKFQDKGVVPTKLGHVAFNVIDVKKVVTFYVDVLGFRVSDWMGDFFAFLRCGPDHHTINLVDSKRIRLNHIAFELRDWAHIQSACDYLSRNGYPQIWGPGRHGIGHNIFAYHRDPDGQVVELFCELDRMNDEDLGWFEPRPWHKDRPQVPKVWAKDPSAANLWGIPPPPGFLD